MHKIQYVSKIFKWLFILISIALPLLFLFFWVMAPSLGLLADNTLVLHFFHEPVNTLLYLPFATKLLSLLICLIPLAIHMLLLYFLIRLFQRYERFDIFSLKSVKYLKYIGVTLLIGQLLQPIYQMLLSLTLTWHNPPGERVAAIFFSDADIGILLAAGFIILISWIMAEGYKLQEDQNYTI